MDTDEHHKKCHARQNHNLPPGMKPYACECFSLRRLDELNGFEGHRMDEYVLSRAIEIAQLPRFRFLVGMRSVVNTEGRSGAYRWIHPPSPTTGMVVILRDAEGNACQVVTSLKPSIHDIPDLSDKTTRIVLDRWLDEDSENLRSQISKNTDFQRSCF